MKHIVVAAAASLLAVALAVRRIHSGLGCKRGACRHGKHRGQENAFHTNLNID